MVVKLIKTSCRYIRIFEKLITKFNDNFWLEFFVSSVLEMEDWGRGGVNRCVVIRGYSLVVFVVGAVRAVDAE